MCNPALSQQAFFWCSYLHSFMCGRFRPSLWQILVMCTMRLKLRITLYLLKKAWNLLLTLSVLCPLSQFMFLFLHVAQESSFSEVFMRFQWHFLNSLVNFNCSLPTKQWINKSIWIEMRPSTGIYVEHWYLRIFDSFFWELVYQIFEKWCLITIPLFKNDPKQLTFY